MNISPDNSRHLQIRQLLQNPEFTTVLIDGPAGAGKTTLAAQIEQWLSPRAKSWHLDDFYAGWQENFDQEFLARTKTLAPGARGEVRWRAFDWSSLNFGEVTSAPRPPLLIAEGVGAFLLGSERSPTQMKSALRIWIECDAEVGLSRVIARDGKRYEEAMSRWLITQSALFLRYQTLGISPDISIWGEAK
jgi:energy-coupling factor transporter ATP-binding protein EcfA2